MAGAAHLAENLRYDVLVSAASSVRCVPLAAHREEMISKLGNEK
jgi:hypothetical protein